MRLPEPDVRIRLFQQGDSLDALTALLHRAYAPLAKMGLNYTAVDQSVADTGRQVQESTCFVALSGDELVGTITVRPPQPSWDCQWLRRADVCSIARFAVAPEIQRLGLGSKLLSHAEAWTQAAGFAELAADTAERATHLIAFYTRRGFRHVDVVQWAGKTYSSAVLSKTLASHTSKD